MAPSNMASSINTQRARSYVFRLPLFTRAIMVVVSVLAILSLLPLWDIQRWGSLIPSKVSVFNG
jgi:glycosylphosphatidylinositol transamidase